MYIFYYVVISISENCYLNNICNKIFEIILNLVFFSILSCLAVNTNFLHSFLRTVVTPSNSKLLQILTSYL